MKNYEGILKKLLEYWVFTLLKLIKEMYVYTEKRIRKVF